MKSEWLTVSNALTLLRIVLVPGIIYALFVGNLYGALLLFIGAAITDLFDGMVARARNECTVVGAILDPIADKFLILSCLWTFYAQAFIPWWVAGLMSLKELLLGVGWLCVALQTKQIQSTPCAVAKYATWVQLFAIAAMISLHAVAPQTIAQVTAWFSAAVLLAAFLALCSYMVIGYATLKQKMDNE